MALSTETQNLLNTANAISSGVVNSPTPISFADNLTQQAQAVPVTDTSVNPSTAITDQSNPIAIQYPLDGGMYFMAFLFNKYQRPSIMSPLNLVSQQIVGLPIPRELVDSTNVLYNQATRPALIGTISEYVSDQINKNISRGHGGESVSSIQNAIERLQQLGNAAGGVAAKVASNLAGIIPKLDDAILQQMGMAPNPFLTVEFTSPTFKQHQFSWQFAPRDPAESERLKTIIDMFKTESLPHVVRNSGAVFLGYPSIIKPIIYPNVDQLYTMKYCVLTNVVVNWAPSGSPAFFTGTKAPAVVELAINLLEIELFVRD